MWIMCHTLCSAFASEEPQGTQWNNEAAWPQRKPNMQLQGDSQMPQKHEVALEVKAVASGAESLKWGGLEAAFSLLACSCTIFTHCCEVQMCQERDGGYKVLTSWFSSLLHHWSHLPAEIWRSWVSLALNHPYCHLFTPHLSFAYPAGKR